MMPPRAPQPAAAASSPTTEQTSLREAQRDLPRVVERIAVGRVDAVTLMAGTEAKAVLVAEHTWRRVAALLGGSQPPDFA